MCKWKGTIATLEYHQKKCWFTLLPCPKECRDENGEVNQFIRKSMETHLKKKCPNRNYQCNDCGEIGTFFEITNIHDKICERKQIGCPNVECDLVIERQYMDHHVTEECGYTVLPCKYKIIGCKVKKMRRDMQDHEEESKQLHLDMAMNTTVQLKIENIELKRDVLKIKEEFCILTDKGLTLKLTDYKVKKETNKSFTFPPFYTHRNGYHMTLRVYANGYGNGGTHISVFAPIVEGNYDAELRWPFVGVITIELLNQLENYNHHVSQLHLTKEKNCKVGSCWGQSTFISHLCLDLINLAKYLKDDTLYFRVSVKRADHKPWLE